MIEDASRGSAGTADEHAETRPGMPTERPHGRKGTTVAPGHLPVTELLFERQGPASPFGEDQTFPLPVEQLPYTHPGTLPAPPAEH